MPYIQNIRKEEHTMTDRTYYAIALDRAGRTFGRVGPIKAETDQKSAALALETIRAAYPRARSYSVGYGIDAPNFDIRNERNIK
jgi:hypothetical protein